MKASLGFRSVLIFARAIFSKRALYVLLVLGVISSVGAQQGQPQPASAIPTYYFPLTSVGMVRIDNKAYVFLPAVWKPAVISVCWEPDSPVGSERTWVEDAIKGSWGAAGSGLKIKAFVNNCAVNVNGIRIAVRDDGANDGPHTIGLGNQLDGKPAGMVLNFTFKSWGTSCAANQAQREKCIRSIAVHEFGHALGFAHEQNSPETPGECAKQAQGPNGNVMLTPWDIHSVMNYCNPLYLNDGVLSKFDKEAVTDPRAYGVKS
jgi:hypothetical protein